MKKILIKFLLSVIFMLTMSLCLFSCGEDEFKVTFIVNGEVYHTVTTSGKADIELPEDPKIDGQIFDGWYVDSGRWSVAFDEHYFNSNNFSTDLFIYSKWIVIHEHVPGEFTVIKSPSCETEGLGETKCTVCEEIILSEKIEKLGHNEIIVAGTPATDTTDGYSDGSFCTRCSSIVTSQTLIPAKIQGTDIGSDFFTISELSLTASVDEDVEEFDIISKLKIYSKTSVVISCDTACNEIITGAVKLNPKNNQFYATLTYKEETVQYTVSIYKKPIYTVSFDTACDAKIESQTVKENSLVQKPNDISNGYASFMGWYLNGVLWDFDKDTPTEDITLVAKWEIKKVKVTFKVDNSDFLVSEIEMGTPVTKPNDSDVVSKHSVEWYLEGTADKWNFDTPIYDDITLEAKLIPILPGDTL